MKSCVYRIAPLCLAGCANLGGASRNSTSPLVHGIAQGDGPAGAQANAAVPARVVSVKPGVVSIFGGRPAQLKVGMSVPLAAIARSDATGKAKLALPGSTVNVAPGTEIALADFADMPPQESGSSGFTRGVARLLSRNRSTGPTSQTVSASAGSPPRRAKPFAGPAPIPVRERGNPYRAARRGGTAPRQDTIGPHGERDS